MTNCIYIHKSQFIFQINKILKHTLWYGVEWSPVSDQIIFFGIVSALYQVVALEQGVIQLFRFLSVYGPLLSSL
jgi:hypothetical protein